MGTDVDVFEIQIFIYSYSIVLLDPLRIDIAWNILWVGQKPTYSTHYHVEKTPDKINDI